MDLLSDADSSVRDSARLSTIRLFKNPNVTSSAKSDLKKEMEKKGTRKQTAEAILKEVLGGGDLTELDDTNANGNGSGNGKAPLPAVGTSSMGTSEDDVSPVYVSLGDWNKHGKICLLEILTFGPSFCFWTR